MFATPAARFRTVAVAEAVSWFCLLVGMLFKYVVVHNEIGVQIFGWVHGIVFVAYLLVTVLVRTPLRWNAPTTLVALLAGIPPFGSVAFERWASHTGRMAEREPIAG